MFKFNHIDVYSCNFYIIIMEIELRFHIKFYQKSNNHSLIYYDHMFKLLKQILPNAYKF